MSEKDQQETLLMAIEYLKTQYEVLQNPCNCPAYFPVLPFAWKFNDKQT